MALCSDTDIQALVSAMQTPGYDAMPRIEMLLAAHPEDARLHFLRGSVLIGLNRHIEAHASLSRAVELAPDFALARFQLGFFELTSGEAANAFSTWGPLDQLPDGAFLRKFVDGLRCLIRDDFEGAIRLLREGQALNAENAPLSRDMQLIIDRCLPLLAPDDGGAVSETSLILGQFGGRGGQGGLH